MTGARVMGRHFPRLLNTPLRMKTHWGRFPKSSLHFNTYSELWGERVSRLQIPLEHSKSKSKNKSKSSSKSKARAGVRARAGAKAGATARAGAKASAGVRAGARAEPLKSGSRDKHTPLKIKALSELLLWTPLLILGETIITGPQ